MSLARSPSTFGNGRCRWYDATTSTLIASFMAVTNKPNRCVTHPNVIRAEIHSLESNDHTDWSDFVAHESPDPYDVFGWFHVTIGANDIDGGNDFQVCVSTPRAVNRAKVSGSVPGILVDRFDAQSIQTAVHDRVTAIKAHTWDQFVDELRTFMRWEYDGMAGT